MGEQNAGGARAKKACSPGCRLILMPRELLPGTALFLSYFYDLSILCPGIISLNFSYYPTIIPPNCERKVFQNAEKEQNKRIRVAKVPKLQIIRMLTNS